METEREVVLKLSAKTSGAEDIGRLTRETEQLAKAEKTYREETQRQQFLEKKGQGDVFLSGKMEEAVRGARWELAKFRKELKEAKKDLKEKPDDAALFGNRGKGAAGKNESALAEARRHSNKFEAFGDQLAAASPIGVLFSPVSAALAAFTLAIRGAQMATENYYKSLEYNSLTGRAEPNPVSARQGFRHFLAENPVTSFFGLFREQTRRTGTDTSHAAYERYSQGFDNRGRVRRWLDEHLGNTAPGVYTPKMTEEQFRLAGQSEYSREYNLFLARQAAQFAPREAGAYSTHQAHQNRLESEMARLEAEASASMRMRNANYGLTVAAGAERRAAIDNVGANPLYDRETQIEDVNREIALRQGQVGIAVRGETEQQSIAAKLRVAQEHERRQRELFNIASASEKSRRAEVEEARGATGKAPLGSKEIERRQHYADEISSHRQQVERDLLATQERVIELRKQGEQSILRTQEQQSELLRANLQTVQQQIEMEKRGRMQMTERLGLLHPREQQVILGLARKAEQGIPLTQADLAKMEGHRDVFRNVLQQEGMKRGTPLVEQLRGFKRLGLDNRAKELQKLEVNLKNEIVANVKLDAGSLTDALVKSIRPEIEKLRSQFSIQLKNELDRLKIDMQAQRRGVFPGAP